MADFIESWDSFIVRSDSLDYDEFIKMKDDPDIDDDKLLCLFGRRYKKSCYSFFKDDSSPWVRPTLRQLNFVDELEGKRFDRYISKANANIVRYANLAYPELYRIYAYKLNSDTPSLAPIVKFVIIDACIYSYLDYTDMLSREDNSLFRLIKLGQHHVICSSKKYRDFLDDVRCGEIDIANSVSRIQKDVYKDYLKECALQMSYSEQFHSEAIMKYIPESTGDCARIFKDIVSRVYFDIIIEYNATHNEEHTELAQEKEIMRKNNEIQALNVKISDLQKENSRMEAIIENLKSAENSSNIVFIDRTQELNENEVKYIALSEKYEKLLAQYNELKKSSERINDNDIIKDDSTVSDETSPVKDISVTPIGIDVNAPYLFIADRNAKFENYIKETFPNAEFTMTDYTMDFNKYNMVIIITSRMSHSMYSKVKDLCKLRKCNYIHCAHTNTERIKQLIGERLAKQS